MEQTNKMELYAKDNNLLQLSLFFFGKGRPKKTTVEWCDSEGDYKLECVCKYGVPGSFDQDVYTSVMRIWVKQGMPEKGVKLNYSDVARELNLDPVSFSSRIKTSLKKLAQARYEFNQCFFHSTEEGIQKIDTHFSLFDTASLFTHTKNKSKKKSQSHLIFPDQIRDNLQAKYYQLLDMVWYRSLKEGLPRRLYEYLAKRKYHAVKSVFCISEEAICRWLPITEKHSTKRRNRLEKISQCLIDAGYLKEYTFDRQKKLCYFTYAKTKNLKEESLTVDSEVVEKPQPKITEEIRITQNSSEEREVYWKALAWIDTIKYFHKKRKQEIASMPTAEIVKIYKGIRREYELKEKKPTAGWIYKAFTEGWEFPEVIADNPETPEDKRAKIAKGIFDSWTKSDQENFMEELREYIGPSMEANQIEEFMKSGKIWFSWAPMLMAVRGDMELPKR